MSKTNSDLTSPWYIRRNRKRHNVRDQRPGELKPCLLCGYSPAQARMENAKGIRFRFVCLNIECPNVTDKRTEYGWAHSKQSAAEYWNIANAPNVDRRKDS